MNRREVQELRTRSDLELRKKLKEDRERLRQLQLDLAAGKVKNVGARRTMRKDIARIMTFLNDGARSTGERKP